MKARWYDALLALGLSVLGALSVLGPVHTTEYRFPAPTPGPVAMAAAAALPLIVRRRWPLSVCVVVTAAVFSIGVQGRYAGSTPFLILIALYTAAMYRGLNAAVAGLAFAYVCIAVLTVRQVPYFNHPSAALFVAAVTGAWAFGRWMRGREHERNFAMARAVDAERARTVASERAVLTERLHIARELHDVVSHSLSVIAVQSGVARHRLEHNPDEDPRVLPALSAIEGASRRALDDLRRMLGVLRSDPTGTAELEATDAPPPAVIAPALVREWLVDITVAVAITALGVGFAFVDDPSRRHHYPPAGAGLIALILLACLPLAARRRWPVPVYLVSVGATVGVIAIHGNADTPALAAFVALYTVAAWRPLPVAGAGLALWLLTDAVFWAFPVGNYDPFDTLGGTDVLVPFVLGLLVRRWRHDRDSAYARALEAERTRAVAAEQAVFADRLLIAGELHDVITHTLSIVAVQAGVMRHHLGDEPGPMSPMASALANIAAASRVALDDLRRMLGVLQEDTGSQPRLSPIPRLAELNLLASAHRATHGPLELTVDPRVHSLPDSVQLTTFRLVQEALTNVGKYAPGAATRVDLRTESGRVYVDIENERPMADGPVPAGSSGGFGLAGMRERAALFGGTVDAGPRAAGGFGVAATLRASTEEGLAV